MSKRQIHITVSPDTHALLKKQAGDIPLTKYVKRLAEKAEAHN
jgi:hypothetical protein